jgi:hypothetical protein
MSTRMQAAQARLAIARDNHRRALALLVEAVEAVEAAQAEVDAASAERN